MAKSTPIKIGKLPIKQREPIWDKVKSYYESDISYTDIIDNIEHKYNVIISRGQISKKAKESNWNKEKNKQVIVDMVDVSKKNETINETLALKNETELETIKEIVGDKIRHTKLITNLTELNLKQLNNHLVENKKLEKVNVGDGVQNLEPVALGTSDYLNAQKTIDQASLTLGVNQRHSNTQLNVNTQNNNVNTVNTKTLDDFYQDEVVEIKS